MLNFTVGPVMSFDEELKVMSEQCPYFRTDEFSKNILCLEKNIMKLAKANIHTHKAVFLSGSGTFGMEVCVSNLLDDSDRAIVVNGGTFGKRFDDILTARGINHDCINLQFGKTLRKDDLDSYDNKNYTAFIVNMHETSSGVLYDMDMISDG